MAKYVDSNGLKEAFKLIKQNTILKNETASVGMADTIVATPVDMPQGGGSSTFTPKIYTIAPGTSQPSSSTIYYSVSKSTAEVVGTIVQYENFYHIHLDIGDTSSYSNGNAIIRIYCNDMTSIDGDQYIDAKGSPYSLTSSTVTLSKVKVKVTKSKETGSILFSYESYKVGSSRASTVTSYLFTIDAIIPYV